MTCTMYITHNNTAVRHSTCSYILSSIHPINWYTRMNNCCTRNYAAHFFLSFRFVSMVFMQQITDSLINIKLNPYLHHPFKELVKTVWIASNFKCRCTACCRLICIRWKTHSNGFARVKNPNLEILNLLGLECDLWLCWIYYSVHRRRERESKKGEEMAIPKG